jgi:Mor family transcriptional regulator
MTTLRYQGNPPPSRSNWPDPTPNRSRPVSSPPSSDLPPQLLSLSDAERSKVLALDHRVLSKLYDVLALPSDIRGRVIPLRYDGKQPFSYRDKVPRSGDTESFLAEGGFRWNRRYGQTDPMPAVTDYTIIEWAVRFRSRNWAVRTGTIPNLDARCLVVVDVDYPELLNVTEHDLFFMSPRLTRRQTERGIHVYAYSETPTKTDPKPKWGEVKAEGQFVMLHLRYSWKETPYLGTLWPDSFLDTLLPYDGNVQGTDIRLGGHAKRRGSTLQGLRGYSGANAVQSAESRDSARSVGAGESSSMLARSDPGVPSPARSARAHEDGEEKPPIAYEGKRDLRLMGAGLHLAGRYKRYRGDYGRIKEKLVELNGTRFVPPLPEHEVDHVARQVAQYSDEWKRKGHNPSWLEERHKRGRRSGTVRKKRVRNRNRRIRRDRASGMRYRDLCIKYEMGRTRLDAICNRRPQRVPIDMELDPSIAHLPPTSPTIRKMVKADHAKGASYKMLAEKYGLTRYQLFIIKHSLPLPLVNPVKTDRLRGAARRILDWQSDEAESPAEEPPSDPRGPPSRRKELGLGEVQT